VVSLGSLIYAPLAQMAPFAIMLLILLIEPTGLYRGPLPKRQDAGVRRPARPLSAA